MGAGGCRAISSAFSKSFARRTTSTGVDIAALARLLPTEVVYAVAGTGEAAVSIESVEGRIGHVAVSLDLDDVVVPGEPSNASIYERVALAADWRADANDGWGLTVSDVELSKRGRPWPLPASATCPN